MNIDDLDKAQASFARIMGMPLDAMEYYFTLYVLSNGRVEFEASDEDLTLCMLDMLRSGRMQKLFRMTAWQDADEEWKLKVEDHISQLEEEIFGTTQEGH